MTEEDIQAIERDLVFAKTNSRNFFYIDKFKVEQMVREIRAFKLKGSDVSVIQLRAEIIAIDKKLKEIREYIAAL